MTALACIGVALFEVGVACALGCVVKQLFVKDHEENNFSFVHKQENVIGENCF